MAVRVQLLGGFAVLRDGEPVPPGTWRGRRARQLVQLLALAEGQRLHREQVMEHLWPDLEPTAASANLHKAAHHARRALGDDAVVLADGVVSLVPSGGLTVDVRDFEAEARTALAGGEADRCADVAATYPGPLLPEALFDPWTSDVRERLGELHRQLLARATPAVPPPPTRPPGAALPTPGLVGRGDEVARLEAELGDAIAAHGPRVVLLRGEAGIGTTALCRHLAGAATDRGWVVVAAEAGLHGDHPYAALNALLGQLGGSPSGPEVTRQQVVARATAAVPDDEPLLLVLDDAETADGATCDLLPLLATAWTGAVVLLLAHRPGQPTDAFEVARARLLARGATEVEVGPLTASAARDLVERVAPQLDDATTDRILELAAGHPMHLRDLARAGEPVVPEQLAGRIVAGLDPSLVADLATLAVVGFDVDATTARALVPDRSVVDAAVVQRVLEPTSGGYRFRHRLVREALLATTTAHQRSEVHRSAATALAADGDRPGRVAQHLLAAGAGREAVPWLLAAARRAGEAGAPSDGMRLADRALAIAPDDPDGLATAAELRLVLGDPGCAMAFARAAAVAPADRRDELRVQQGWSLLVLGEVAAARDVLQDLHPSSDHGRLRLTVTRGYAAWFAGDMVEARGHAAAAREVALIRGGPADLADAIMLDGLVAHGDGEWPARFRQSVLASGGSDQLATLLTDAHLCVAESWLYGGWPYPEVIAFATDLALSAERSGAARGAAFATVLRGEAELLSGDVEAAVTHLTEGADQHRRLGASGGLALALQRLAETARAAGRPHEVPALLAEGFVAARSTPLSARHLLPRLHGAAVATGGPEGLAALADAEASLQGPAEVCPFCLPALSVPAAIVAAGAGELDRARFHAAMAEHMITSGWERGGWVAALDEVRGHLARAEGDDDTATAAFARAATEYEVAGQPLDARRARDAGKGGKVVGRGAP